MSRTDVHRPYEIQLNDWHNRHRVYRYSSHHEVLCSLTYSTCGCYMCSGWFWRREERRRSRHNAKQYLRSGRWELALATK